MHFLKMTTGSLLIIMGIGWGGKKYLFLYVHCTAHFTKSPDFVQKTKNYKK